MTRADGNGFQTVAIDWMISSFRMTFLPSARKIVRRISRRGLHARGVSHSEASACRRRWRWRGATEKADRAGADGCGVVGGAEQTLVLPLEAASRTARRPTRCARGKKRVGDRRGEDADGMPMKQGATVQRVLTRPEAAEKARPVSSSWPGDGQGGDDGGPQDAVVLPEDIHPGRSGRTISFM